MALTQISTKGIKDGTITGSDLATNVDLVDNQKIRFGTGNDLQIFHDPQFGHSFIKESGPGALIFGSDLYEFYNAAISEKMLTATENGAVELYHNNSKKFETTSGGCLINGDLTITDDLTVQDNLLMGDTDKIAMGDSSDLEIYHDGTFNYIAAPNNHEVHINANSGGSTENMAKFKPNGAVELYHNNSKKFETRSGGAAVFGHLELGDNDKVMLGNSNDLQIYHDSIGSIIQNNTGPTIIRGAGSNVDIRNSNDEIMIRCNGGSSVDIRHGNSKKFETTSSGVGITGNLEVGSGQITCGVHGTTGMQIINNGVFGTLHSANLTFRTVSSTRMVIDTNGNIGAPSGSNIYNASDKRLKKNIVDIDKGLSVVKALRPVSFNWIDGFCDEEKQTLYGFIAQEVQTVDSNLINQFGSDGVVIVDGVEIENTLRVNDKFITPILVKAVQEAIARIEALETEVAALKAA